MFVKSTKSLAPKMLNDNTKEMISLDVEGNQITMSQDRKMEIQNDLQNKS